MRNFIVITIIAAALFSCNKNNQSPKNYDINEASSTAEWKGSATDHFHVGSFAVKGSFATNSNGIVSSGNIVIPIASIQDYDLQDPIRQVLLDDLKSANFFNVLVHPDAGFTITKVVPFTTQDTAAVAGANYLVTGDFTMVGQTHALSFPAKITTGTDSVTTEAKFDIDRIKWGMNIYSDPSKDLYILPQVKMHLNIKAAIHNK